jgi:hypothetical protein
MVEAVDITVAEAHLRTMVAAAAGAVHTAEEAAVAAPTVEAVAGIQDIGNPATRK